MKITTEEIRQWGHTAAFDQDDLRRRLAASNLVRAAEVLLAALQKEPLRIVEGDRREPNA